MTISASPTLARLAAIGIFVAGLLLFFAITVAPVWSLNSEYQHRIDDLSARLKHAKAIARQDSELRQRYSDVRQAQRSQGFILESRSEALAAAELQRIIKDIADTHETNLVSTQILPAATEDELTRVSLRAHLSGPFENIVKMVYDLESYGIFLFLDNFSIQQSIGQRVRSVQVVRDFDVHFDLSAYLLEAS
jgi:hypothetical protein